MGGDGGMRNRMGVQRSLAHYERRERELDGELSLVNVALARAEVRPQGDVHSRVRALRDTHSRMRCCALPDARGCDMHSRMRSHMCVLVCGVLWISECRSARRRPRRRRTSCAWRTRRYRCGLAHSDMHSHIRSFAYPSAAAARVSLYVPVCARSVRDS